MKKKAVDYAKNTVRLSLVGGWEKDKATLQGELATLRMAIVSDPNALDTSKEQSAIKSKISILTSAIAWANSSLKTDSAAI